MTLFIDASDWSAVKLTLGDKVHIFESQRISETLLPEIKKFLKKQKVKFSDLKKVDVHPGPGHFSRIRTAVAVANGLVFGLGLNQKLATARYNKSPNITKSKKIVYER